MIVKIEDHTKNLKIILCIFRVIQLTCSLEEFTCFMHVVSNNSTHQF